MARREYPVGSIAESIDTLARSLLECRCDFDFIDDDVLAPQQSAVVDGKLKVGEMTYGTVCIPQTQWINGESRKQLEALSRSGGKVLWAGDRNAESRPEGSEDLESAKVTQQIPLLLQVEPQTAPIRACKRALEQGALYFITNEDVEEIRCTVRFQEELPLIRLDPETGACWKPGKASFSSGEWRLPLDLEFGGSCVVFFSAEEVPIDEEPPGPGERLLSVEHGWELRRLIAYRVGDHDLEFERIEEDAFQPVSLGDWRPILGEGFSGDAQYRVLFSCDAHTVEQGSLLGLGSVNYACEVELNGRPLGRRAWRPYTFPIQGILREGENELKIAVTNTFANQYVTTRKLDKWPKNILGWYHEGMVRLETESLASGLFGPVTILEGD